MTVDGEKTEPVAAIATGRMAQDRYYDVLRSRIVSWLDHHVGERFEPYRQALFLVPDVFALVFRLAQDNRVKLINRIKLWGLIIYILSPVDINIDFILPLGPLDDLALSLVVLDSVFEDTPDHVLEDNWSGDGDAVAVLRGLTRILWKIKRPRRRSRKR